MSRLLGTACLAVIAAAAGCSMGGLDRTGQQWDTRIGHTKDDIVRHLGIPTRCHIFQSGGELCEWPVRTGGGVFDTLGITFDKRGTACQWNYRGFYGDRQSVASCS